MPVELQLMSGYAPKVALAKLGSLFERETAVKSVVDFSVLSAIHAKIAAGARPDIIIMPIGVIDSYVRQTIARGNARASLGIVRTVVAIKKTNNPPDLSSLNAFRESLLRARAIAHAPANATPSGAHCGQLMESLSIASEMAKKTIYLPALEGGIDAIVNGHAQFGIYPRVRSLMFPELRSLGCSRQAQNSIISMAQRVSKEAQRQTRLLRSCSFWQHLPTARFGRMPASIRRTLKSKSLFVCCAAVIGLLLQSNLG